MRLLRSALVGVLLAAGLAWSQQQPCVVAGTNNAFLGIETIRLWPGAAPEARGTSCEDTPTLTIFSPQPGHETGAAVVILPGGGYGALAGNLEGREVADWFAVRGVKAYVLSYRLSSHGYLLPVPLLDARRAVQTVRARAVGDHVDPKRVVMIGFSAGGHLAALAATRPVEGSKDAADPVERFSSRPDFLVLGYPWLGAISKDTSQLNYCVEFNIVDRCAEFDRDYTPEHFVSNQMPPTFIFHTYTDGTVPVEQSLRFVDALAKAKVPAEVHIFAQGPHGVGLGRGDAALDEWPGLLEIWLRNQSVVLAMK